MFSPESIFESTPEHNTPLGTEELLNALRKICPDEPTRDITDMQAVHWHRWLRNLCQQIAVNYIEPGIERGSVATTTHLAADCQAWKTSFARDQRANHIQNHDHDCTATCVKYQKKKQITAQLPQRAGRKLTGPGIPKCRFRCFRHVPLKIEGSVKYVSRRGIELLGAAQIACGNDENEYGKALTPRHHPFRSSSSDLLQSVLRCNCDYQYHLSHNQMSSDISPAVVEYCTRCASMPDVHGWA